MSSADPEAKTSIGRLWLWVALGAGITTSLGLAVAWLGLGRFVHETPHIIWAAPISFACILAPIALVIRLAKRWLGSRTEQVALTTFVTVAGYGALLNVRGIHPAALWLIALGTGIQLGRQLVQRPVLASRVVSVTTKIMIALLLVATVALFGNRWLRERRAIAALPAADRSAPNVLLLVLDTVRSFSLSVYGSPRPTTPSLEMLAATGAVFETAFSTAPWTLPSHASIMTGTWAFQNRASWTVPLDQRYPTLAEELSKLGYVTGGFIANTKYTSAESGLARGFSHYSDWVVSIPAILRATELGRRILDHPRTLAWFGRYSYFDRRFAPSVTGAFQSWRAQHRDRPFFAFLNVFDAHAPYEPPAPFDSLFGAREKRNKPDLTMDGNWPPEEVARHQRAYEASIAYQDHMLGELLSELERDGTLDSTIVIVTSDHGEEFFEYNVMGHGHSLYPGAIRVPLIYRYPSKITPRRVAAPVSIRTISSTIWDLLGRPAPSPFPGPSAGRWLGPNPVGDSTTLEPVLVQVDFIPNLKVDYPISHGPLSSVIDSGFQYIVNKEGTAELYRLSNDPVRGPNLIGDPTLRTVAERLAFLTDSMTATR